MARASVNEAQRMVDDLLLVGVHHQPFVELLLDAVKNKTVQVGDDLKVFELREEHDVAAITVL